MYLKWNASKARLRDAENARKNRLEIVKALSTGQVSRRDLVKWGVFTTAGLLAPIGGLNPFVGSARASGGLTIPTGTVPSPQMAPGASKPWVQPMFRLHSLTRHPLTSTGGPDAQLVWPAAMNEVNAMRRSNTTKILHQVMLASADNKSNVVVSGTTGPMEGRPPGEAYAHQRWNELVNGAPGKWDGQVSHPFAPVGTVMSLGQIAPGLSYNLANNWPAQDPSKVWTFSEGRFQRGAFPPILLQARYGETVINRIYNNLPFYDPIWANQGTANFPAVNATNGGFGRQEPAIHNHNGHNGAESDGAQNAHFFPGEYYDYNYSLMLARRDGGLRDSLGRDLDSLLKVNRGDVRCSTPTDDGKIIRIPGDFREIQSTLWFHDHRIDFTSQDVYKGYAALLEYFSGPDRGYERPLDDADARAANLRLPSGWRNGRTWGNRDFDVYLAIQDVAFDQDAQLYFDIFDTDGFLGDCIHVNYQWKPVFEVLPRKYRFRTLSAGMSRWVQLGVADSLDAGSAKFVPITIIANDGNIFPHFVRNAQFMDFQGTAERYDFVLDFSQGKDPYSQVGKTYYLVNLAAFSNGRKPDGTLSLQDALSGNYPDPCVGAILEFKVVSSVQSIDDPTAVNTIDNACGAYDMSSIADPGDDWQIPIVSPVRTRTIEFVRGADGGGLPFDRDEIPEPWGVVVNGGLAYNADMKRSSNIPRPGDIENWNLVAGGGWAHPVHLHFEEGRTLSRTSGISAMELLKRKDVWHIGSVGNVTFQVTFGEFGGAYVNHCHNTVHEDNAMLIRYDLMKGNNTPGLEKTGMDDIHMYIMPTPDPRPEGVTYVKTCYLTEGNPQGFDTQVDVCTSPSTGPAVPQPLTDPRIQ